MDQQTLQGISDNFYKELQNAQHGDKNSLAFIQNTLPSSPLVQENETFQVMVVGGTNFRTALVKKTTEKLEILEKTAGTLPRLATKEIFFSYLLQYLKPTITHLAVNFGYPIRPVFENNRLDSVLVKGVKEHTFEGLVNEKFGAEFEKYIFDKKGRNVLVSSANDTICLLLAGLTEHPAEGLAAGIVGTGMNFAIFLDNQTAVNLEAGAFANFPRSEEGITIDNTSLQVGANIFEKEISGGFLFQHFNLLAKKRGIPEQVASTEDLDRIAQNGNQLAREVMASSAKLVATVIAGIMHYKKESMTFVMQGSLFWKSYHYKEIVTDTVKKLAPAYELDFIEMKDEDLLGAAKLIA